MLRLEDAGNSILFIRNPVPTKEMWDGVKDVHSTTLNLCIVLGHSSKKPIPTMFRNMLEEKMECRTPSTPHLKIAAWKADRKRSRDKLPFALDDLRKILMPRQARLKKLDLSGSLSGDG